MTDERIGIAMIARNAAEILPHALDPFEGIVDEVAIVEMAGTPASERRVGGGSLLQEERS